MQRSSRCKTRPSRTRKTAIWLLAGAAAAALWPATVANAAERGADRSATDLTQRLEGWSGPVAAGAGYRTGSSRRVTAVQRALNRLGHDAGAPDGLFGPRTDAAVRRFQAEAGIAVDGIVGPRTLDRLSSRLEEARGLIRRGTGYRHDGGSQRVREVQRALTRLGYDTGAADGLFGARTEAAVTRFQARNQLAVDGIVGPRTTTRLRSRTGDRRILAGIWPAAERRQPTAGTGAGDAARKPARDAERPSSGARSDDGGSAWDAWDEVALIAAVLLAGVLLTGGLLAATGQRSARARSLSQAGAAPGPELAAAGPSPNGEPAGPDEQSETASFEPGSDQPEAEAAGATAGDPSGGARAKPSRNGRQGRPSERKPRETSGGPSGGRSRGARRGPANRVAWRHQQVDASHRRWLQRVGARLHLAEGWRASPGQDLFGVELELFAEGALGTWSTHRFDDNGRPFLVSISDLEESVRAVVMRDALPVLARTLRETGLSLKVRDLERVPFVVELTLPVEHELARRRFGLVEFR